VPSSSCSVYQKDCGGCATVRGVGATDFYDETCFSCPAGTTLMTTAVMDVPVPDPTF